MGGRAVNKMLTGAVVGLIIGSLPGVYGIVTEPENVFFYLTMALFLGGVLGCLGALVGAAVGRLQVAAK